MAAELVTMEQAKLHLRVIGNDEDAGIQLKLNAATEMAVSFLDRAVYATKADMDAAVAAGDPGPCPMVATDMVRAGILLLLGDLYANREEVITGTIATQLPTGAKACLLPLRRMGA
ncbi:MULTISPECIES: head-tail connector protein [Comamonas]|uniref:head-tail connector protein n=1 Tax=Comamonas TaxID=283 RepID=UPI0001DA690F|nr:MULTISPECIES: head-tail connector protein [Comamonas]EFI59765.1 hypothetical protein CTS44_20763 [Comamonas thiooxydans]KGG82452.1 hypothetical protein P609_19725 [Comamonas thiooxydans]TFF58288.1 phage gp6-like head-tail connector protein [Comamonas sp. A23]